MFRSIILFGSVLIDMVAVLRERMVQKEWGGEKRREVEDVYVRWDWTAEESLLPVYLFLSFPRETLE